MTIEKPQLHGLAVARTKKWLVTAIINAILGGTAFQVFYINRKKRIYREFYEDLNQSGGLLADDGIIAVNSKEKVNYDIDKEFEAIRAKGLFDSC